MIASRASLMLSLAALGLSALCAPSQAAAITLAASDHVTASVGGAACYRSPDITFDGSFYYVAFAFGPCNGVGAHDIKLARIDPTRPGSFTPITIRSVPSSQLSTTPLVRISSVAGNIAVLIVDRTDAASALAVWNYNAALTLLGSNPLPASSGVVQQVSFDCGPGAVPPCAVATLVVNSGTATRRVYSYFDAVSMPQGANWGLRTDSPTAVSVVVGGAGQTGTALLTDSASASLPNALVTFPGAMMPLVLGAASFSVFPSVVALRLRNGNIGAFWASPGFIHYFSRPSWTSGMTNSGQMFLPASAPYFLPDDGAAVGNAVALVGRASSTSNFDGALLGHTSFVVPAAPGSADPPVTTMVVPRSPVRVAAAVGPCDLTGSGMIVYTAGATQATELRARLFSCSTTEECLDPRGGAGTCVANTCQFPRGTVCNPLPEPPPEPIPEPTVEPTIEPSPEAGLDSAADSEASADASGLDSSSLDANVIDATISSMDVITTLDGSSTMDATGSADARADAGSPPAVTGGACNCRVAAPRSTQSLAPLAALVACAIVIERRARRARR